MDQTQPGDPSVSAPNPGSDEARAAGCICAVLDNNHGKFAPWPPDEWFVTQGCPVHAWETEPTTR